MFEDVTTQKEPGSAVFPEQSLSHEGLRFVRRRPIQAARGSGLQSPQLARGRRGSECELFSYFSFLVDGCNSLLRGIAATHPAVFLSLIQVTLACKWHAGRMRVTF